MSRGETTPCRVDAGVARVGVSSERALPAVPQVRCSRESVDPWAAGGLSAVTFQAEISMARALTKLGTIQWYPPTSSGGFESSAVSVPPGMAFDTNFYPGDFGNAAVFGLGCGATHYFYTRVAFAIFQMAEGMLNAAAVPSSTSHSVTLLSAQIDRIFVSIEGTPTSLPYVNTDDGSQARESRSTALATVKSIVTELKDDAVLKKLLTSLKPPQVDATTRFSVAIERDDNFFTAMDGVRLCPRGDVAPAGGSLLR